MSTEKRERELARAKFERQQARRAERELKARRNQRIAAAIVASGVVIVAVGWVIFNATSGGQDSSIVAEQVAEPFVEASSPEVQPEPISLACSEPGTPRADNIQFPEGPTATNTSATSITLATNCGDIVIALDPAAPETVASEVFLTESGFYDETSCHRLTTEGIFVLQCGDPAGNGTGGPGYSIPDENLPANTEANYPAGTVAMANAGPGTSGSQFFIVYQDSTLPPGYSIWGQVTSGLDIIEQIASLGAIGGTDGPPLQPVFINTATVS
jgi:peptidyl-prolyl cis-trans isomerase B (cyclophilin B)